MSRQRVILALLLGAAVGTAVPSSAQIPREDVIWARAYSGAITLDGVLNEAGWNNAESVVIRWQESAGMPGSGWKGEGGVFPSDPTEATLKFLVKGNQLYLGAFIPDHSVGGSSSFNRFDGLLMALKDHIDPLAAPKPPAEYFYAWWYPENPDPQPSGQSPAFIGRWATWPPGTPRSSEQIAAWDAVTVVNGLSNSDTAQDTGYTIEMRFDLTPMGYDVTQAGGDVLEWNVSVYDCDWFWPLNPTEFSSTRTWWQGPWGNTGVYNEVRIHARPDVTTNSGPVPALDPTFEMPVLDGSGVTVDGNLSEAVWSSGDDYEFDMRWDDPSLRQTYPGVGPHRAGQYQPPVYGGEAFVFDPADATIHAFVDGNFLYLGFDVRDQVVQYHPSFDRWDGFLISINDRAELGNDNEQLGKRLSFQVGAAGAAVPQDYLSTLVGEGNASVAIHLNAGTTVDTLGTSADNGYQAEVRIDLTALGYPDGLGDRVLFLGMNMLDGDSFLPVTDSYGTRTWWFREYENTCCPPWIHIEGDVSAAPDVAGSIIDDYAVVTSLSNPSQTPGLRYSLPEANDVRFQLFDASGRLVEERNLGTLEAGSHELSIDGTTVGQGTFFYRLELIQPGGGAVRSTPYGKLTVLR